MAVILGQSDPAGLAPALNQMIACFAQADDPRALAVHPDLGAAFGQSCPAHAGSAQVGYACGEQVIAVLEGELVNSAELGARLNLPRNISPAAVVAWLYATEGPRGLERLRGHWSAAVLDRGLRCVVIANDTAGLRPLYRGRASDGAWVIASSPAAVLAHGGVPRAVDPAGLADTLAFGFALGARTLFEGVDCLPPASVLTWEADHRKLEQRQYWELGTRAPSAGDLADLERIRLMFNQGVADIVRLGGPITLALSGGMDSRAILSALLANGASFETLTHSIEEATDAHLSVVLARLADAPHHFYKVTGEGLRGRMAEGVRMMGGRVAAVDVHPLCFLDDIATYSRVVLTGMGGAVYKVVASGSRTASEAVDPAVLSPEIFRSYNKALRVDPDFGQLLRPDWLAELAPLPRKSLDAAIAQTAGRVEVRGVSGRIFFEERMRKLLSKGDMIVRRDVETRHPLLVPEVIEAVYNLPYSVRADGGLLRYVVTQNAPALADQPYERDGRPMRYLFTPWQRAQDRAARRIQQFRKRWKLGGQPRRVYSYRYGDWIRRPLNTEFRQILLDERTLSRPYWRGEVVATWLDEHAAGQDRSAQLSLLFALELTLRECIDARPGAAR
jgi:asparagine synthetase B (glutamine-hydrolysing)